MLAKPQETMVYSWANYKNTRDEIMSFTKQHGKKKETQWAIQTDQWQTELDGVMIRYFVESKKLILSGDEGRVKVLAAEYKEYIMENQRKQGVTVDNGLKTRRH